MIELAPDRLSVFAYAHMPKLFKMQRQMDAAALPSPAARLAILQRVVERLDRGRLRVHRHGSFRAAHRRISRAPGTADLAPQFPVATARAPNAI